MCKILNNDGSEVITRIWSIDIHIDQYYYLNDISYSWLLPVDQELESFYLKKLWVFNNTFKQSLQIIFKVKVNQCAAI